MTSPAAPSFVCVDIASQLHLAARRSVIKVTALEMSLQQVEEALHVLYTTNDAAQRQSADAWLRAFQDSVGAWQVALDLLKSAAAGDHRLFGATVLCTKLRGGGGGGLPPESVASLRGEVLGALQGLTAKGRLRTQCCRATALLLGDGGTAELLADPRFAALPIDATLELLAHVPESGAWLSDAEVERMQLLMLSVLDHACNPPSHAFPRELPVASVPVATSGPYRIAVLACACKWVALPAAEGLTLGVLSEAPCFGPLMMRMAGAEAAGDDCTAEEQKLSLELCHAALELEPEDDVFTDLATVARRAAASSARKPTLVGTRLPYVPAAVLLAIIANVRRAAEPLARTAARSDGAPNAGGGAQAADDDDEEDDDDEDEDGEAATQQAIVQLGGTLLRKASALLAGDAAPAPGVPWSDEQRILANGMASLLEVLLPCCAHRRRAICETTLACDFLSKALGATDFWEPGVRGSMLAGLAASLTDRALFPLDATLASWDTDDLEEYVRYRSPRTTHHSPRTTLHAPRTTHHAPRTTHHAPCTTLHAPRSTHHAPLTTHHAPPTTHVSFREGHLASAFAELARHDPLLLLGRAVQALQPAALAAIPWQRREATLFAASCSLEAVLARVLPPPHTAPPPEAAMLATLLPPLVQAALAPPTLPSAMGASPPSPAAEALLLCARCTIVRSLAPWLASSSGAPCTGDALAGVAPCLSHPAAATADAGLVCLLQLTIRCAAELANPPERLNAILSLLGTPTPALPAEGRCRLLEVSPSYLAPRTSHLTPHTS